MNQAGEQGPGRAGLTWVWVLVCLPLLYVLSMGPVVAVTKNKPVTSLNVIKRFYAPVIWLHDHTFMKKPLEVYTGLWGWH
jgi:hypothetical protein